MNTFKRKALTTAVLGTLGVAGSAHAIWQDTTDNRGEALVYPYYTVNADPQGNPFWTIISVVNTTSDVKVVKVRFREGKASAEVLDFNLYLSPNDMWTGAVVPASADATSPAHLVTSDNSCTNPLIPAGGVDFRNYQYTGPFDDPLADTLDRTREGYAEMFEMAVLDPLSTFAADATHDSTGVPADCAPLRGSNLLGNAAFVAALEGPTGGLTGTGTIINVLSGRDTLYKANAFSDYSATNTYSDIGNDLPNFSATNPPNSVVVKTDPATSGLTDVYFSSFSSVVNASGTLLVTGGAQAASSTMMHTDVINEFVLDAATNSNTDWVFTFPTKRLYVSTATAVPPFSNRLTASGACETIGFTYFNREELTAISSGVDFSPTPPGATANSLCFESTVLTFRNGSTNAPNTPAAPSLVLGSNNVTAVAVGSNFQNGWADVNFAGLGATSATTGGIVSGAAPGSQAVVYPVGVGVGPVGTGAPIQYLGLPVLGFMVRTFSNGLLQCTGASCLGNYLGNSAHSYRTFITP
jgi:hypothetical protein